MSRTILQGSTLFSQGKADCKAGGYSPDETFWVHLGPDDTSLGKRDDIDNGFLELTRYLSEGLIDFDFVSESICPNSTEKVEKS